MQTTGHPWNVARHEAYKRLAAKSRRESAAATAAARPAPLGEAGWDSVVNHEAAFAAAGLCETWRLDLGDKTARFRFSDFPPGFNFSGMWWRKLPQQR